MADNDKTAETSKPADGQPAGPKAGGTAGASQPPGAVKPGPEPTDVKSGPKPAATKPAAGEPRDQATRPGGPGSEWTASDDRGPLGRAEDEIDGNVPATSSPASRAPASKAEAAKTSATTPEMKTSSAGIGGAATAQSIKAKTVGETDKADMSKGTGPGAPASVPPVDAAQGPKKADPSKTDPSKTTGAAGATKASPSSPTHSSSTPASAEAKRSLWPVAAALILGAVIGAGSAAFVYRGYADDTQPDPKMVDLTNRVAALEKRPDSQAAIGSLKTSMTALATQVAAIRQGRGSASATPPAQAGASRPAASQPAAAPPATADLGEINQKIAALQTKVDQLKPGDDTKALEEKVGTLQRDIDQAKSTAAAAQTGVTAVQGQQKDIASRVMMPALAVVADSLVQQIDHGQPYATQVDALAALGADPAKVAVLRQNAAKGVPSAPVLAAKFEPLVQPITATVNKAPPNASLGERLKSNMFSIVSIRRADDTSGTDLPSRVARIQAALAHDDVAGALDALNQLPPDAKAKAEAWGALAKTHVEAMNAARALQQDAIAALGSKKS